MQTNPLTELAKKLVSYRNKPVQFVENIIGATPDPWQREALEAVAAGKSVAIRSGHGTGKSALLSWIILWFLVTRPYPVIPCTAPTQHQLSDILWAEVRRWLNHSKIKDIVTWTATRIGLVGNEEVWFAVARSCAAPENLAGFHSEHLLYIVDEASGIEDEIMSVVDGALTTENAIVVMAGNPTKRSGYFFDAFHASRDLWHRIHISSEDSPRVGKAYAERMAAQYGRDSDIYRVRVKGDFPLSEADGFIGIDAVESAVARYETASDSIPAVMGVDVARYGDDDTVFVIRKGNKVSLIERHHGLSIPQTAAKAIELAKDQSVERIAVDDSGVGGGVTDLLLESDELREIDCGVIPVNNGSSSPDPHYANLGSYLWGNLKNLLSEIAIPDDEELIGELTTRRYSLTPQGRIRLERKEEMKRRRLPSPDSADALALAFFEHIETEPDILFLDI